MNRSVYLYITQTSLILVDSQQVLRTGHQGSPISGICVVQVVWSAALQVINGFIGIIVGLSSGASKPN